MRAVSVATFVAGLAAGSILLVDGSRGPVRFPTHLPARSSIPEAEHAWQAGRETRALAASPGSVLAPSASRALSVVRTFAGASSAETSGDPPDPSIGVGAGFVVQTVNSAVKVWTSDGVALATYPLASFFAASSDDTSDPRIVYDAASRRWFASAVDVARASIQIAVSAGPDPTGAWTTYTHASGSCPDQPSLGVGGNLVLVGYGAYSTPCRALTAPTYLGGALLVYDKRQLIAGVAQAVDWGPRLDLSPITAVSPTGGSARAVALVAPPMAGGPTDLVILRLPDSAATSAVVDPTIIGLPIRPLMSPPPAEQAGTSQVINTNDVRILSAVTERRTLWLAGNDGCVPRGDRELRSCLRIIAVTGNRISLDKDIGSRGRYFFYPALAPVGGGDLVIVHGFSSATGFPGLSAFKITPGNRGTREITVGKGTGPDASDRFGDYFGAATDSTGGVWVTGETGLLSSGPVTSNWATTVASVTAQPAR